MNKVMLMAMLMLMVTSANALKRMPSEHLAHEDFSGVYHCDGNNRHNGQYAATATMTLKPEHSKGSFASYDFKLEVADHGTYLGHAAADGHIAAIHLAFTGENTKDYGTGIAKFRRNAAGKLTFRQFYYEPEYKGGNTGHEVCTRQD